MPITAISNVVTNLSEYARAESDKSIVTVYLDIAGTSLLNTQVRVELRKTEYARDVIKAWRVLTSNINVAGTLSTTFDLNLIVDEDEIPLIRRGEYYIYAYSVADSSINEESEDFLVSLITVDNMKASYLHGVDAKAFRVLMVKNQPSVITGVEVLSVSSGHPLSFFNLVYNISTDDSGNVVKTLSWCNGPLVSISTGINTYILRNSSSSHYIEVRVDYALLPAASVTEQLIIENGPLSPARIREIIERAISWVEDDVLTVFLEPTRIVTNPAPTVTNPVTQSYPVLEDVEWDKIVDAVTYQRPSVGHWINFKFPYQPILKFNELWGEIQGSRVFELDLSGVEFHSKGGFVEIVPYNQSLAGSFVGLAWVETTRGTIPIPNFWSFDCLVGYRKTPPILLELVAKKSAIDLLVIAGAAFRGPVASQSISRDGVSESVSYIQNQMGIYGPAISVYKAWIDENLASLRGSHRGVNLCVL